MLCLLQFYLEERPSGEVTAIETIPRFESGGKDEPREPRLDKVETYGLRALTELSKMTGGLESWAVLKNSPLLMCYRFRTCLGLKQTHSTPTFLRVHE